MEKKARVERLARQRNEYLAAHPRAGVEAALRRLAAHIGKLRVGGSLKAAAEGRRVFLETDGGALERESKLDGCYVLKTDLRPEVADKELVHSRYKDLADVEQAFRRAKTVELEMRPVYVRSESSTRGHLLVVMLAYRLMRELGRRWSELDVTVAEGLQRLNTWCALQVDGSVQLLPKPREDVQALLDAAGVIAPSVLASVPPPKVATKRKLPSRRKAR